MKNKIPLVSVVMLNYNGLKYLKRTISPILKLDYPNYEFIIVDNGSTDGSIEFIKKLKKIKLIENKENLGYGKGKNIGVKHAKGEFVLLLDNDIVINNFLLIKILLKYLHSLKNVSFLSFPMINDKEKKIKMYIYLYGLFGPVYNKEKEVKNIKSLSYFLTASPLGGNIFFNRKIRNKIGDYDESQPYYLDDFDIGARSSIFGYDNYIITEDILTHLGDQGKNNLEVWSWKYNFFFSGMSRVIIKNYSLKNLMIIYPLFSIFALIKTLKYCIKFKSFNPIKSLIKSLSLFLGNLPDTLKQRKIIQSKRVIKEDIFLKIKPPKFD